MVRVRFAPSPTGLLHIGNARTALFNWLFARHEHGKFLLRIEDTDKARSTKESEKAIMDDLLWMGLDWDEGPEKGGPYGPYRQSERMALYREYADRLLKEGRAYPCYCSAEEIDKEKKRCLSEGGMPRYSGRCRALTERERAGFEREGRRPVIRLRAPDEAVLVSDLVRGEVRFEPDVLDDFIILRSDGTAAYNFAVVVDDALMHITHILRGEDHLSNTPKQISLYEALGLQVPQFGHMSMILGPDHTRLSKRHGATSVEQYRAMGILPEALVNYLALLGWSSEDGSEVLSASALVNGFSLKRLSKSSAIFDPQKLLWLNGNHIRSSDLPGLARLCKAFIPAEKEWSDGIAAHGERWWEDVIDSVRAKIDKLRDVADWAYVYFENSVPVDEEARDILKDPESRKVIDLAIKEFDVLDAPVSEEELRRILKAVSKNSGVKGRPLYMALRVAITGSTRGPEMDRLLTLLDRDEILERLKAALQ